jgi:sugar lactone lactonase YvrE
MGELAMYAGPKDASNITYCLAVIGLLSGCSSTAALNAPVFAPSAATQLATVMRVPPNRDPHYDVCVASQQADTVTVYRSGGDRIRTYSDDLASPWGVATNTLGLIYVANAGNDSITTFFKGKEVGAPIVGGIDNPRGIAIDASGKLYVANYGSNSITTYATDGTQSFPTITQGIDEPVGVAVDDRGNIFVTNAGSNTVTTYRSRTEISLKRKNPYRRR